METLELLVGLLAAIAVVVDLAGRTSIPEPVLLVAAGLAIRRRRNSGGRAGRGPPDPPPGRC